MLVISSSDSEDDHLVLSSSTRQQQQQNKSLTKSISDDVQGIHCLYINTIDIVKIAADVVLNLKRKQVNKKQTYLNTLESKKRELEEGQWTYTQYQKRCKEIADLEKQIEDTKDCDARYRNAVGKILDRWTTCTKTPQVCFPSEIDECIALFTKVTSSYVPMIAVKLHHAISDLCFICEKIGTLIEGGEGQLYCSNCKNGRQVLSVSSARGGGGGDATTITTAPSASSSSRGGGGRRTSSSHQQQGGGGGGEESSGDEDDATETDRIELILKRFQGKQSPLPQAVYDSIEAYLNSRSILKQHEIRFLIKQNPSNHQGTSLALLEEAMRATRNERAYKDKNAVAARLWGWDLPVFTPNFEAQIIADYRITQSFYPIVRGGRRSRINADYRLLRHLVTRGFWHPILEEYKLAATSEVLDYNDEAWEKMCKLSGLPLVPLRL